MMAMRRTALLLLSLLALVAIVHALAPPPVYEHKAARNYKGTNCEVCQAVVKQTLRKLPGQPDLSTQKLRRAREQKVSDLLESVCAVGSFSRYEFSPPIMVNACNDFVSNHGEELETLLFKGATDDVTMRNKLCIDTKICQRLWTPEEEEQKRDRSPEEQKRENEDAARASRETAKREKEEEKKKKKEAAAKKKEEAAAKKAAKEAAEAAEAAVSTNDKTEL